MDYYSREIWCHGELVDVETLSLENGKRTATRLLNDEGDIRIETANGTRSEASTAITTNHWNEEATITDTLFNTITGDFSQISVELLDETEDESICRVSGDIQIDTRYDHDGHWLGMSFERGGSIIRFNCEDCRNTPDY